MLAGLTAVAGVLLLVAVVLWLRCGVAGCPDPADLTAYAPGGASILLDRHGEEVASLHPLEAEVVPLAALPPHLPSAFVSVEDQRFERHGGVDWIRVVGAALRNVRERAPSEGASTITMQLARTLFPERIPRARRDLSRKLVEVRVALAIERRFSKEEILELYLNHVYLGGGAHGVEAAARYYFDRPATELTLSEAALVAGVARAPALYDPRRAPERALMRRNLVITLMEDQGGISEVEAAAAREDDLGVTLEPPPPTAPTRAPWFTEVVRRELDDLFGQGGYASGLRIHTTLDAGLQRVAEEELAEHLAAIEAGAFGAFAGARFDAAVPAGEEGTDYLQAALVVMEPSTGDVLALVGGRDYGHSRFNRAVAGRRPVGSAFKPFVYAAALSEGFVASQPLADRPFQLDEEGTTPWSPRNHDGAFRGRVGMRESLVSSLNVPTVRLGMAVGLSAVGATASRFGLESAAAPTPAYTLGTASLSPLELTAAYTPFAAGGLRSEPRFLLRVENEDGTVLYEAPSPPGVPAVDPGVAYILTDILQEAVRRGTGAGAVRPGMGAVAGKTGTTQEGTDAWFVGYTPGRVGAVWVGHDRPRPILAGASGGRLAAPLWGAVMSRHPEEAGAPAGWERPPSVIGRTVDPISGLAVSVDCGTVDGAVTELFLESYLPVEHCPEPEGDDGIFSRMASAVRGFFNRGGGREESRGEVPDVADTEDLTSALRAREGEGTRALLGFERVPLRSASGR
ncbi:MAG: PBP1A family penicillin-binding protein [Gemmatimonadota bacterium]